MTLKPQTLGAYERLILTMSNPQSTFEHARASIVGIVALGGPVKHSTSLWTVPTPDSKPRQPECLGVLASGFIFSCAHIQDSYGMLPTEPNLFEAWCMNEPDIPIGTFQALYASSLDYLVLSPDSFTIEMSDGGGTESGVGLHIDFADKWGNEICPARLEFPSGCDSTKIRGYYFAADGKTPQPAIFRIFRNSHEIDFYSEGMERGGDGSPIFTDEHQLIGFVTVGSTGRDVNGQMHCLGRRIDQGLPPPVERRIKWDTVHVRAQSAEEQADPTDPWKRRELELEKLLKNPTNETKDN